MTESDPPLGPWVQNFFCQRLQAQQRVSPARGWPSRSNASTVAWCSRCPYRKSKPSWRPPTRLAPEPDAIGGSSVCSITPAPVFPKLCNSGAKTLSGDPPAGFASTAKDAENAPSRGCRRWRGNSNARWPKAPRPPALGSLRTDPASPSRAPASKSGSTRRYGEPPVDAPRSKLEPSRRMFFALLRPCVYSRPTSISRLSPGYWVTLRPPPPTTTSNWTCK